MELKALVFVVLENRKIPHTMVYTRGFCGFDKENNNFWRKPQPQAKTTAEKLAPEMQISLYFGELSSKESYNFSMANSLFVTELCKMTGKIIRQNHPAKFKVAMVNIESGSVVQVQTQVFRL